MNEQPDVLELLLKSAQNTGAIDQKFSDQMRARRQSLKQFAGKQTLQDQPLQPGVNPFDVYGARNEFTKALEGTRSQDIDLLSSLVSLAGKDKELSGAGSTIDDLIATRSKLSEAGFDTSDIDKALEEKGLKKTGAKVEDVYKKVSTLPVGQQKDVSDLSSAVREISRLKSAFEALKSPKGFMESLVTGTTGPLATTVGEMGESDPASQLRSDLDTFKDKIRKDLFGSAFTETEKKSANLPGSARQEAKNQRIIESFYKQKVDDLKIKLKNAGFSDDEIKSYVEDLGASQQPTNQVTTSTGSRFTIEEE